MIKIRVMKTLRIYLQILLILGAMISFSQLIHHDSPLEQSRIRTNQPVVHNSIAQEALPSNLNIAFDASHLSHYLHNVTNLMGNYTAAGSSFNMIGGPFSIPAETNVLLIPDSNKSYTQTELNTIDSWFNQEGSRLLWVAGDSDYDGLFNHSVDNEVLERIGANLRLGAEGVFDDIYNDGANYRVAVQTPVKDGKINSIVTTDVSSVIMHAPCPVLGYQGGLVVDLKQTSISGVEVIMEGSSEVYALDQDLTGGEFDYYSTGNINGSYPLMAIQTMAPKKYVIASGEVIFSEYKRMYDVKTANGVWNGGVHDGKTLVDNTLKWFGWEVGAIDIAVVFSTGGLGGTSFNDMVYVGLLKAESDGLCHFNYSLPIDVTDFEGLLDGYAAAGTYDLIVAVSFAQKSAVETVVTNYPSQPFLLLDDIVSQGNVSSIVFKEEEGSFLAGAMASLMTQTGKIGFIGGLDVPLIRRFWAGYKAGALYVKNNSYIEVVEDFVGDFGNPTKAKSMAEDMWAQGVDIIYAAAGNSGDGIHESAYEQGFYSIGVDGDQDSLFPGTILTSMMKRLDMAVYNVIEGLHAGSWSVGVQKLGLTDNGVGISPLTYTKSVIGPTIIDEVNITLRNQIISGEIIVPQNSTALDQWIVDINLVEKIKPDFNELVDSGVTVIGDNMQLTVTIKNIGDPAPTGLVPIHWEKFSYTMPLFDGLGKLEESLAEYDINGDGDKIDIFDVTWAPNETRPYDAVIDGVHAYALPDTLDTTNRTYYIDGKSKLFQLPGSNNEHILYRATNDYIMIGFDSVILQHPSPNFELVLYANISATDFKINGVPVEVSHESIIPDIDIDGSKRTSVVYIIPYQTSIVTGEAITISCTLTLHEGVIPAIYYLINWSPDGHYRKFWIPFWHEMTPPVFLSPTGGEILSGIVDINWEAAWDDKGHSINYEFFYSPDGGVKWIQLESNMWDTTTVADGTYLLKIVATCSEGYKVETISQPLTIKNEVATTTTTTTVKDTTSTTTTTDAGPTVTTPGFTGVILVITVSSMIARKKLRKKA